ncbi:Mitochondrial fission protein ELM1 [Cucurbita argyrosperma subsp. argyrosperma]|nr:Mitochondrial fission protein ELM1 [Cucurbita argyrosperma subsp. argyrosperma]
MRPIRLPEPPNNSSRVPEIFDGGVYGAIRRAVVIGNGFPGAESQCLGLVRALGLSGRHSLYRVMRPRGGINRWLHWLPVSVHKKLDIFIRQIFGMPLLTKKSVILRRTLEGIPDGIGLSHVLEADAKQIAKVARETFDKDGPLLVIASGRDTISVASSIKRFAPENVFVVQIQHPRSRLDRFDLVIAPRHDYYSLTPQAQQQIPWLLRRWITPCEPPGKNVVLTVGALHRADFAALRCAASTWHDELAYLPKPLLVVNIGGPSRPNPHLGHLAWADAFVITADSVSMLSEACSTGKPVYVIGADRCTWKFADFQKSLAEQGVVRPFTGKEVISESWSYSPLNDTADAANRVNSALAARGWRINTTTKAT